MFDHRPPRTIAIVLLVLAAVFGVTLAVFSGLLIVGYGYQDYGSGVAFLLLGWALALGLLAESMLRLWKRLLPRR